MAPTAIEVSALAGLGTRRIPSLPIAITQIKPAADAWFTSKDSGDVPLSPGSSEFGFSALPYDIDKMSMPLLD